MLRNLYVVSETEAPDADSSAASSSSDSSSPAPVEELEKLNTLLTCPARNFFARFSLAGEIFLDSSW